MGAWCRCCSPEVNDFILPVRINKRRSGSAVRLHEYEAKKLFLQNGISIPGGGLAKTSEEAERIAAQIGRPVIVKAQILVGGRKKSGGIGFAETPEQARTVAQGILGRTIRGERVQELLVEERLDIERELYAGVTVDTAAGCPIVMVSAQGGIDIETTASENPDGIISKRLDIFRGLRPYEARSMAKGLGFRSALMTEVANTLLKLYGLFESFGAMIAEINPLVITRGASVVAADAVFEVDDSTLFRHPELKALSMGRIADPLSREGRRIGVSYVGLDGDIGVIASGAGLGMATVDLIGKRGRAANFLETGGGITQSLMADVLRLILKRHGLRGIIINLYGGINPIHEGAKGIAQVIREENIRIPIVAKALGNFQEETWRTFEEAGVTVVKEIETERAVEELFRRMGE